MIEGGNGDLTPMTGFVTFEPEESFAVSQILRSKKNIHGLIFFSLFFEENVIF